MLALKHTVDPANVPEAAAPGETPSQYVVRLAREKASDVAKRNEGALVIGGDTVVVRGGEIIEKPLGSEDAVRMLSGLSGNDHQVYSGLALVGPDRRVVSEAAVARVRFRQVSDADIRAYVATGEPLDKAGAYGIQGLGSALVESIDGDYFTVVGLSVALLVRLLEELGYCYRFGRLVPR